MLERVMLWLFPRLQLEGTPFYDGWHEQERDQDVAFWRILFPALAIGCLAKGYLVPPDALVPSDWLPNHWMLAGLCLSVAVLYRVPSVFESRLYRYPAALGLLAVCYLIAATMVSYGKEQYLATFIVIIVAAWCLRTSMFFSACFVAAAIFLQWDSLQSAGVSKAVAISFSVGVLVFVAIGRADYASRIRYYLAQQNMIATQEQAIEMSIEFSDRIRAFLPKEISSRVTKEISDNHLTVQQAVDTVLRPEERRIACLFTDIRGFTRGTKENKSFVSDGVIPNVVRCSRIVEKHLGIPRKVGDLLFAYFDDASAEANVIRCLSAACEIVDANARFNQTNQLKLQIRRYLLVSTGTALVGNLGGLDSSIEISAQGGPVDLLSQMDQLTKSPQFREHVNETDVVLCAHTAKLLSDVSPAFDLRRFDLARLGANPSDFKGIDSLWVFAMDERNKLALAEAAERISTGSHQPEAPSSDGNASKEPARGFGAHPRVQLG